MGFGKNQPETAAAEASDRRDVSDVSHWDFVEIFGSDVRAHCFALCVSFLFFPPFLTIMTAVSCDYLLLCKNKKNLLKLQACFLNKL